MKVNDAVTGALLVALAAVILWHVRGFPEMPGQRFGPAWFPGLIASGLAACGALLIVQGVRSRAPSLAVADWVRRRRPVAGFVAVIAGLAFYVLAANTLGFHITGFVLLLAWMRILGARWTVSIAMAIAAPVAIHLAFYSLLRVPLPWGVLERFAY